MGAARSMRADGHRVKRSLPVTEATPPRGGVLSDDLEGLLAAVARRGGTARTGARRALGGSARRECSTFGGITKDRTKEAGVGAGVEGGGLRWSTAVDKRGAACASCARPETAL